VPFYIELAVDEEVVGADIYPASTNLNTLEWKFDQPVKNVSLKFKASDSPDIYGIALDGKNGIAVDNIALRGNNGLSFTRLDRENLRQHYNALNVKMIILQFGGNIVPNVTDKYIKYYEERFYQQIMRIKSILPNAAIIVMGVADMSYKEKTYYVSRPRIDKIRDAMKNASFRAGAAYWDMYKAMGGENSMPSWVNEGLARSDYVHFSIKGARVIAKMFYAALIAEYNKYKEASTQETSPNDQPEPSDEKSGVAESENTNEDISETENQAI
jgi:lysophospholipase L1-like esterase